MFRKRLVFIFTVPLLGFAGTAPLLAMEPGGFSLPSAWSVSKATEPESLIELTFAVKQRGLEELHNTLMRVSDPTSLDYGKHLSNEQVHALTAPDPKHILAVEKFLMQHAVQQHFVSLNSDFIVVKVPIKTAEKMLSAKYMQLKHGSSGVEISRTPDGYSLPGDVFESVDFVAPTVHVPGVHNPQGKGAQYNMSGIGFNTPKNLRQLYGVDVEGKAANNKQAVTAFLEQGYSALSLKAFWALECRGIHCGKGDVKVVGDRTRGLGTESMLDIETITGVAGNVESEFWGFGGRSPDNPENEPFTKWLTTLSNTSDSDVPKIFSTSYGEDEASWSLPAATRLNVEFQKAGVRGVSLLYAAGDEGANCEGRKFVPEGPGSSPYVTAVGGTMPTSSWPKPGADSEAAIGLSSGGFSNYWKMPSYQKDAVAAYLKQSGLPPLSRAYNISGRAYPDISAQATNFFVISGFPLPGVSGTSCASPTAAGIFSLLNDLRMQQGKSTLGFLNPFIYQHAAAFNDITTGSSQGCDSDGWPAKKGWDAVTGVGTPNYANLAKALDDLPAGRIVDSPFRETVVV